ncbi:MAG: hypothetical protein AB1704_01875 [Pseudomonadota bacterium]|uniref:hypothetical protein n=1 Tax=Burkholderiaceae TaxID=119060 RepID=UPI0010F53F78|nr:hypothetical protein [Burkholderia sp. 4M9327F10]
MTVLRNVRTGTRVASGFALVLLVLIALTLVEQAAAAADTLKEQAHALHGAVAVFRVDDAANGEIRRAA